ncbi:outer membrane beta-barrel protein [uncultured Draconibacterium sp.]|uniref:outer membrane beta-barrel protein n=1 Tax=uncultured Draconibacterium sp. TaxID=1573823 RepID=UPI00263606A0|nr:outer membrane beta-barrel protein [uncultured Draconibacterium sp.]
MKLKPLLFAFALLVSTSSLFAQEFAVDKGATFISGVASFTSQGGELFEDYDGNNASTFNLSPSVNYFVGKNFFIGGGLEFAHEKQGDYKSNNIGLGPQIGYAFGNEKSTAFPYFDIGLRYYGMSVDYGSGNSEGSGTDIFLGAGIVVPVKSHLGITFEAGYHMMDINEKESDTSYSGNIFAIGIGIVGLLF